MFQNFTKINLYTVIKNADNLERVSFIEDNVEEMGNSPIYVPYGEVGQASTSMLPEDRTSTRLMSVDFDYDADDLGIMIKGWMPCGRVGNDIIRLGEFMKTTLHKMEFTIIRLREELKKTRAELASSQRDIKAANINVATLQDELFDDLICVTSRVNIKQPVNSTLKVEGMSA